jgi:DNA-binding beta-propeller fold protein YncE
MVTLSAALGLGIELTLEPVGGYETGVYNALAAEIVSFHPAVRWLFITNGSAQTIDVVNINNVKQPKLLFQIPLAGAPTSVAAHPHWFMIAASCQGPKVTDPGTVEFFTLTGQSLGTIQVGSLPDTVKWTPDGRKLLVANEGEPTNTGYEPAEDFVDPEGSLTIITLAGGLSIRERVQAAEVVTADFTAFNDSKEQLLTAGVRIFGPGATVAHDLEPENIAVTEDGKTAYLTLQENNAIAVVDIDAAEVTEILAVGYKDHSRIGSGLDAANNKNIDIRPWPLKAIYQPDGIMVFTVGDQAYLATANEGDIRDVESTTVGAVTLSNDLLSAWPDIQTPDQLAKLKISSMPPSGLVDGVYSELYCFGGRSFTLWGLDGTLVFDSGDQFEQITAAKYPEWFNANHTNSTLDARSGDKGCEPESLVIGEIDGCPVAFVGLERQGGIMAYDLSNPAKPRFLDYVNRRDFKVPVSIKNADGNTVPNPAAGDLSMEGLLFVSQDKSPTGKPLVIAAHEVSGTTTIFEVNVR